MKQIIFIALVLAFALPCAGQEGRWVQLPAYTTVINSHPEIYCYQVTVPAGDERYDSVQCDGEWIQFVKGWDTWIDSRDSTLRWYHWDLDYPLLCDSCFLIRDGFTKEAELTNHQLKEELQLLKAEIRALKETINTLDYYFLMEKRKELARELERERQEKEKK